MRLRTLLATACCLVLLAPAAAWADEGDGNVGPPADELLDDEPDADATDGPRAIYGYEIEVRGQVHSDPGAFAATAAVILDDARGWTLGGSLGFQEVASGGDFDLVLASPAAVEAADPVCSPNYSCRVGDQVLINDRNWRNSTTAFREAGGDLATYRRYLINHEVGHFLGFGHSDCGGAGQPAPVMQQQSIDLQACEPHGWPLDVERDELADRLGVVVHPWEFHDVLVHHVHREPIDAVADAGVALGYADGTFRPDEHVARDQMASFLTRALDLDASTDPPFPDVPVDSVHADGVAAVAEAEIALGFEDGTFGPDEAVSRGQMAAFLTRAHDLEATDDPPFADAPPGHVHAEAIAAVAEAGIALGHEDGTFRPGDRVERGHMAAFLARAHPDP